MKTKITFFCLLLLMCFSSKAQNYVTIPDANFAAWLNTNYPSCMNGNQMDTTCTGIKDATYVDVSNINISNLTGIEYFVNLGVLNCQNNQLSSLPALSNHLYGIYCGYNQLTSLPTLSSSIRFINCNNNQLTSLPDLTLVTKGLDCSNNNISCFPIFSQISMINISGNPFTCLPNYISSMDAATLAYPLCKDGDIVNNPNGCISPKAIKGTIYKDNNSNCIFDLTEQRIPNIHLKLYDTNNNIVGITNSIFDGSYQFLDTSGVYRVVIDTVGMPFNVQCSYPGIDSIISTIANPNASNINFGIACKPGFDVGVQSVLTQGRVFPGEQHRFRVVAGDMSKRYQYNCATGISGQVKVTISGPVTFDSITSGARTPSVSGNVFTYVIPDFGTVDMSKDFGLLFTTNTTAQSGDQVCVNVLVTPSTGDNNLSNNNYQSCYTVFNSYDPNMKEVYPVDVQPGYQDYFTYTIHFQNKGTASAQNIRLTDTLDSNLDLGTFQVTNYSHQNTFTLRNNAINFHFPNIMLADSATNEAASKGYVQYRIKAKSNLPVGTQIKNKAYIYFDFNPAIVTNTTINEYTLDASIKENEGAASFMVYPNPSNGNYFVELLKGYTTSTIEVYNLLGKLVLNVKPSSSVTAVDLSNQPNGIYLVRVNGVGSVLAQRIIKQ